jgi:hypothetical protein
MFLESLVIVLWIAANATIVHFDPMPWPLLLCLASVPQLPLMIVMMWARVCWGVKRSFKRKSSSIRQSNPITTLLLSIILFDKISYLHAQGLC